MTKIHIAKFGDIPVRFVLPTGSIDMFVCKKDITQVLLTSCSPDVAPIFSLMFETSLTKFLDKADRKPSIVDIDTIGLVVHSHAIGTILNTLGSLHDMDSSLRESAFRFNTVFKWYLKNTVMASNAFNLTLNDMLGSVVARLDRINPAYVVQVTHAEGMWIAESDALGLVTEAKTYEALVDRVWEIAPELLEMNEIDLHPDDLRLSFQHVESSQDHRLVN